MLRKKDLANKQKFVEIMNSSSAQDFVGKNYQYYKKKWELVIDRKFSLNWMALLLGPVWYAYRKMYFYLFCFSISIILVEIIFEHLKISVPGTAYGAPMALLANYLYLGFTKKKISKLRVKIKDESLLSETLKKKGGVSISAAIIMSVLVAGSIAANIIDRHYSVCDSVKTCLPLAERGNAKAQSNLGAIYYVGDGAAKDYNLAFNWSKKAAEQGAAYAQYNLSSMYYTGNGIQKDYNLAFFWAEKAAKQGLPNAQNNLGIMYGKGIGVTKDENLAFEWTKKAAEQGVASAQSILGAMYKEGMGVAKDEKSAFKWTKKAAYQGYAAAQNNLGDMYYKGIGVTKDYNLAFIWFNESAKQGYVEAQCNIANAYHDGIGVERDDHLAFVWTMKAADQGIACSRGY